MKRKLLTAVMAAAAIGMQAQTSSDTQRAFPVSDFTIPFDVNDSGKTFHVKWGMDTAWDWDWNVLKGVAHYGKGNFETGRLSFQPTYLVKTNADGTYELTEVQKQFLLNRINHLKLTGITQANINCDNAAALDTLSDGSTGFKNYTRKVEEWYKLIKASVKFCQDNGMQITSISPYNEPDFEEKKYWWKEDFLAICQLIRADSFFDGIRLCGGNTLNCDGALTWYNYLRDYIEEGNTHQLAGSFDNYANFFTQVKKDGKIGVNDELHNVGEAIVGVNYGMENGIWWGFDAKARGQFMHDSNEGVRIGYGEDRPHWVSGAVYRNDQTGEVHGYLGSSERQANPSTAQFVSTTKDVFFNGFGPARMWTFDMPGGKGYGDGQIGAELLFDITWGEDVAPYPELNDTFAIVNERSSKFLTMNAGSNVTSTSRMSSGTRQNWKVARGYTDGDVSYWFIDNAGSPTNHLYLQDWNLNAGADVVTRNNNHSHNEQWYIKYAGDGAYYIISRLSNKDLSCSSTTSGTVVRMADAPTENTTATNLKNLRWYFIPVGEKFNAKVPDAPHSLSARQRPASIELSWMPSMADDLASYTIIRADLGEDNGSGIDTTLVETAEWNTLARQITGTTFVDNNVLSGHAYAYKVVAVNKSCKRSEASGSLIASPIDGKSLVCQLQFDSSTDDVSPNHINASLSATAKYTTLGPMKRSGNAALNLTAGDTYAMLPYAIGSLDEVSIATWVRLSSDNLNWARIFDFGNSTSQYMFLTPNHGSELRFVMKNGGNEQIVSTSKLSTSVWHHVVVTIKPLENGNVQAIVYVDGKNKAQSDKLTIKPSDIAPSLCYIGRSIYPADPLLKGYIDDFRIYNYALSADEVAAIMSDTDSISADIVDSYTDVTTAIKHVNDNTYSIDGTYDLSGRRVISPTKGTYIINGIKKQY